VNQHWDRPGFPESGEAGLYRAGDCWRTGTPGPAGGARQPRTPEADPDVASSMNLEAHGISAAIGNCCGHVTGDSARALVRVALR
jgi:hypothetical protein